MDNTINVNCTAVEHTQCTKKAPVINGSLRELSQIDFSDLDFFKNNNRVISWRTATNKK